MLDFGAGVCWKFIILRVVFLCSGTLRKADILCKPPYTQQVVCKTYGCSCAVLVISSTEEPNEGQFYTLSLHKLPKRHAHRFPPGAIIKDRNRHLSTRKSSTTFNPHRFFSTNNNIFFSNKNQVAQSVVKNSNLKLCFLRHSFQFQMRLHSKTARLTPRDVHRAPQPSQPSGETAGWSPATFLPGRPVFFENQKGATETEETTTTKIGQILLQKPRLIFETLILKIDMWVHFFKLFSIFFSLLIRRKYNPCFQEVGRSTFLLLEMMFLRVPTIRKFSKRFSNVASQFLLQQQRSFLPKKRYPLVN